MSAEVLASLMPQFKDTQGFDLVPPRTSPRELASTVDLGCRAVASTPLVVPGSASEHPATFIGQEIRRRVTRDLEARSSPSSEVVRDWAVAEGVCEYVKRNVSYDYELAASTDTPNKIRRSKADVVLADGCMKAECWGIAVATRDVARAAGLKCFLVNGHALVAGKAPTYGERNHSVVVFVFDGFQVPADVTAVSTRYHGRNGKNEFGGSRKVLTQHVLPRDRFAWNLFLARFNADVPLRPDQAISDDEQNKWLRASYSYQEWAALDIAPLTSQEDAYIAWERRGRN